MPSATFVRAFMFAKAMIAVKGVNHYAEDVEAVVRQTPGAAGRRCAAFAWHGEGEEEFLVVLWEAPSGDEARAEAVSSDIRRELRDRLGLTAVEVCPVAPASIPFTSSGKVKRAQARLMWPELPQSVPSAARGAAREPGDES